MVKSPNWQDAGQFTSVAEELTLASAIKELQLNSSALTTQPHCIQTSSSHKGKLLVQGISEGKNLTYVVDAQSNEKKNLKLLLKGGSLKSLACDMEASMFSSLIKPQVQKHALDKAFQNFSR